MAAKPLAKPAAKLEPKPAAKPIAKAVSKPVAKPVAKAVSKSVSKPVVKPVVKSVSKPVAKPVVKPVSDPVAKTVARRAKPSLPPEPMPEPGSEPALLEARKRARRAAASSPDEPAPIPRRPRRPASSLTPSTDSPSPDSPPPPGSDQPEDATQEVLPVPPAEAPGPEDTMVLAQDHPETGDPPAQPAMPGPPGAIGTPGPEDAPTAAVAPLAQAPLTALPPRPPKPARMGFFAARRARKQAPGTPPAPLAVAAPPAAEPGPGTAGPGSHAPGQAEPLNAAEMAGGVAPAGILTDTQPAEPRRKVASSFASPPAEQVHTPSAPAPFAQEAEPAAQEAPVASSFPAPAPDSDPEPHDEAAPPEAARADEAAPPDEPVSPAAGGEPQAGLPYLEPLPPADMPDPVANRLIAAAAATPKPPRRGFFRSKRPAEAPRLTPYYAPPPPAGRPGSVPPAPPPETPVDGGVPWAAPMPPAPVPQMPVAPPPPPRPASTWAEQLPARRRRTFAPDEMPNQAAEEAEMGWEKVPALAGAASSPPSAAETLAYAPAQWEPTPALAETAVAETAVAETAVAETAPEAEGLVTEPSAPGPTAEEALASASAEWEERTRALAGAASPARSARDSARSRRGRQIIPPPLMAPLPPPPGTGADGAPVGLVDAPPFPVDIPAPRRGDTAPQPAISPAGPPLVTVEAPSQELWAGGLAAPPAGMDFPPLTGARQIPQEGPPPAPEFDPNTAAQVIEGVKVYGYGQTAVHALAGVTASFQRGHFTAIMGPSGSGKSTLMHCLAGLDRLSHGRVLIGDVDLSRLGDKALTQLRRDRVGFIFQTYNLVPTLTAIENITLPLDLAGKKPDKAWIDNVVRTLRIGDRLKHKPAELSGGQQQRVAVARALATRPQIIFADEPTGNLDTRAGAEVLGIMRDCVQDLGQTVVMVTHDPGAASYADRAIFLVDGRVVAEMPEPTAEKVLDQMKTLGD